MGRLGFRAWFGAGVIVPLFVVACSGAGPEETLGSEDDALKAAPGCQPPQPGGLCSAHGIVNPNGVCVSKLDLYSKAEATCKAEGRALREFAADACASGGASGAKFLCCDEKPTPPPPPPPPPRKCFGGGFVGDYPPGVPCPDAKTLASQVTAICAKAGYEVSSFSVGNACQAGGFDGAKYECCEPKIDPPPPPPPPRKCFGGGFVNASTPGGTMTCQSSEELSKEVTAICAKAGYEVNSFAVGAPCVSGGFNGATYECCEPKITPPPPPPPPPPPVSCSWAGFGTASPPGGSGCLSAEEIEKMIAGQCKAGYKGVELSKCADGSGYNGAKFYCCN